MWTWTTKKISYVGVLIAVSVVFVLIGSMLFAITAYPSFKVSFAGLPVKLTGYLFGPLIGAITGFFVDILTFLFLPTFYHPGYTLTMAIAGAIPGVVMWIMIKHKRTVKTHFFSTLFVLVTLWLMLFFIIWFTDEKSLLVNNEKSSFLTNLSDMVIKIICLCISLFGITVNIFLLFIFYFNLNPKKFVNIAPILMFTSILGIVNAFMLPLWDMYILQIPYGWNLFAHYLLTFPVKLLFNLIIIYIACKIVVPIVNKSNVHAWK